MVDKRDGDHDNVSVVNSFTANGCYLNATHFGGKLNRLLDRLAVKSPYVRRSICSRQRRSIITEERGWDREHRPIDCTNSGMHACPVLWEWRWAPCQKLTWAINWCYTVVPAGCRRVATMSLLLHLSSCHVQFLSSTVLRRLLPCSVAVDFHHHYHHHHVYFRQL